MKRLDFRQAASRLANTSRGIIRRRGVRTRRLSRSNLRWAPLLLVGLALCITAAMLVGTSRSPVAPRSADVSGSGYEKGKPSDGPSSDVSRYDNLSTTSQAPAPMPTTAASGPAISGQEASASNQIAPPDWDRMVIRTATLQITVKDVGASLDQVRSLADAHAGYISGSDSHIENDHTVATITMQVPAREFDSVMTKLRAIGIKVTQENVTSSDVTEEYTDLQSQLRNLQATETRMLALQQKADKLEDVLTLDRELRQVQGDIEKTKGRTNFLSTRSEMSTITLSLSPEIAVPPPVKVAAEGWNPGEIAAQAWSSSLQLLSRVAGAAITVAVFMWWAVPLLLLALWLAVRPRRRTTAPSSPGAEA